MRRMPCLPSFGRPAPLVVCLALAATACAPRGVTIPPGAEALEPCDRQGPVDVELLAADGAPGCDMEGTVLVYPDGRALEVGPVGVTSGSSDTRSAGEIQLVNWGVPGVGAAYVHEGEATAWASTAEALDLQRQQLVVEGIAVQDITPRP